MCWCRPEVRTPNCGRPGCHPPPPPPPPPPDCCLYHRRGGKGRRCANPTDIGPWKGLPAAARTALLALALLCVPAAAAPVFQGDVRLQAACERTWERLPARVRRTPDFLVREVPEMPRYTGYYQTPGMAGPLAVVSVERSAGLETWIHEVGHHHYYTGLTEKERRRWTHFWKRNRRKMPTDYARTNANEGFAEVFEAHFHRRDFLGLLWQGVTGPRLHPDTRTLLERLLRTGEYGP